MGNLNPFGPVRFYAVLFANFIRLWRDLADENGMILRRKRNVILLKLYIHSKMIFYSIIIERIFNGVMKAGMKCERRMKTSILCV